MDDVFKAVRSACSPSTWSQGVELVRRCAVTGVSSDDDEIICRVKKPGRVVATTVTLFPGDAEWDCDCGSTLDACECVAATVIAVRRARSEGHDLPELRGAQARIAYRFARNSIGLALDRVVIRADGSEEVLQKSLASLATEESLLSPSQVDLNVDRALMGRYGGVLQTDTLVNVLTLLSDAANVELDGESIGIASRPLAPSAQLVDDGKDFALEVQRPDGVEEILAPGAVLAAGRIHRIADTELCGVRLEKLPYRRTFRGTDVHRLATRVLPELRKRIDVDVVTERLPRVVRNAKPRVVLDVEQAGHSLSLMATVVYGDPPMARVDGDTLVHLGGDIPARDVEAERGAVARLRAHLSLMPGSRMRLSGSDATEFAAKLDTWGGEIRGARPSRFIAKSELGVVVDATGSALDLHLSSDAGRASMHDAVSAWQQGLSLVPLAEGGWAPLPAGFFERHGQRILDLLAARDESGQLRPHALPALAQLCDDLDHPRPAALSGLEALVDGFSSIPSAKLPADLSAELREYQRQGVDWLSFLRDAGLGATLADDMGLGKTLQALCCINRRTLVVCPTSVLHNWEQEAARFRPGLRVSRYHGPGRMLSPDADLVLTTYALLRLDRDVLTQERWGAVVLDEAQTIKNPESQVAQAAFELEADFRLTLSGTPVENRLEELWSQFHFTNRGLLGGRADFRQRFADPIATGDDQASAYLRSKIGPFLLRRLKREVARELPPRTDVVLRCELDERERAVYDAVRAATQKEVVERLREGGNVMAALEALLRLRQAACHSALLPGQEAASSSKVDALVEALDNAAADQHKALVFSQWTRFLDLIEPHLIARGIDFLRLDGTTRDRGEVVQRFQDDHGPPVLLLSLKAGGTGLNLTSADHVFLMDLWWNPAVEDQAADRAHRIGQERPVMVYRMVSRDTVEERIVELQAHKRALMEAALGDATGAAQLTRDDLLALLE